MIRSGVEYLDRITGGLRLGDNVVWQISSGVPVEYFITALIMSSDESRAIVYVNFNYSPHTLYRRFERVFGRERTFLIDAFTHGRGNSDQVFLDFYDTPEFDGSKVICIENPRDIGGFLQSMNRLQEENREGAFYVFDSLTGMSELWKDEKAVLDFFTFTCPKLYDLNTVAYWIYERDSHTRGFMSGLNHITQVVFTLGNTGAGYYDLKVLKLGDRPSTGAGGSHAFRIVDREIRFQEMKPAGGFRLGGRVKSLRKSRNITQADLAARLNMTPGAVSQIENDIITPSLQTMVQLAGIFGKSLDFFIGPELIEGGDGYRLFKKKEIGHGFGKEVAISALTEGADPGIRPYMVSIEGYGSISGPLMLHKGREFVAVTGGTMNVTIGGASSQLRKGDSILLEKDFIEKIENPGKHPCEFIYIQF